MILLETELSKNIQKGIDNFFTPEIKIIGIILIIIILICILFYNKIKSSVKKLYYKKICKKYNKK